MLGLGLAAFRDAADFFRYETQDDSGTPNPVAGGIDFAIVQGTSQSGNFAKTMIHLGFTESDRVTPAVASGTARSRSSRRARPRSTTASRSPAATASSTSRAPTPCCGGRCTPTPRAAARRPACSTAAARPARARRSPRSSPRPSSGTCACRPGIVGHQGGRRHSAAAGSAPLLRARARRTAAATARSRSRRRRPAAPSARCELPANPMPDGRDPARAPRGDDRLGDHRPRDAADRAIRSSPTARSCTRPQLKFPTIPGKPFAGRPREHDHRLRLRHELQLQRHVGLHHQRADHRQAARFRPTCRRSTATATRSRACKPLLGQLPLGTYTGWNVTTNGFYKGQACAFTGGFIPFAKTKAERLANNDPRPSLEERYGIVHAYYYAGERDRQPDRSRSATCCRTTRAASSTRR